MGPQDPELARYLLLEAIESALHEGQLLCQLGFPQLLCLFMLRLHFRDEVLQRSDLSAEVVCLGCTSISPTTSSEAQAEAYEAQAEAQWARRSQESRRTCQSPRGGSGGWEINAVRHDDHRQQHRRQPSRGHAASAATQAESLGPGMLE